MKKIALLTIASFCLFSIANSQITKGSLYFGGSIGYGTIEDELKTNNTTTTTEQKGLNIMPAVGIALKPNLIAGVSFNYSHNKTTQTQNNFESKSSTVGGGLFLRKYFNITQRFYAFGEALAYYYKSSGENKEGTTTVFTNESDGWQTGLSLSPGLAYNITKAFYLEMGFNDLFRLQYSKDVSEQTAPSNFTQRRERSSFGVGSSLSSGNYLNVGVRFIIPKK